MDFDRVVALFLLLSNRHTSIFSHVIGYHAITLYSVS
jgi:hypothetical protein